MTQPLGTILLVCSSHEDLGATGNKTGFWLEELAAPYYAFLAAGYACTLAAPDGANPPIDPTSLGEDARNETVERFQSDPKGAALLSSAEPLHSIPDASLYDGVFLVGGHGTMWDFPSDAQLERLLVDAAANQKAIGAVCHGVAGLLGSETAQALGSRNVTGFSNEEENHVGLTEVVPFLLEDALKDAGYSYTAGSAFAPNVVVDRNLATGQNPASSGAVADAMVAHLSSRKGM